MKSTNVLLMWSFIASSTVTECLAKDPFDASTAREVIQLNPWALAETFNTSNVSEYYSAKAVVRIQKILTLCTPQLGGHLSSKTYLRLTITKNNKIEVFTILSGDGEWDITISSAVESAETMPNLNVSSFIKKTPGFFKMLTASIDLPTIKSGVDNEILEELSKNITHPYIWIVEYSTPTDSWKTVLIAPDFFLKEKSLAGNTRINNMLSEVVKLESKIRNKP